MIKARRSKAWIEALIGRLRAGCREIALFGTPRCRVLGAGRRIEDVIRGRDQRVLCVRARVRARFTHTHTHTHTGRAVPGHRCIGARVGRWNDRGRRKGGTRRARERQIRRAAGTGQGRGDLRKRDIYIHTHVHTDREGTRPKSGAIAPSDVAISLNMRTTIWRPRRVRT